MIDVLLLRFDAPLMSFGGPMVDNRGPTDPFPGRSLVCGLLGNALGWEHADKAALTALQARLRVASRADRAGELLSDFQTVDLGQEHLSRPMWTTRGRTEHRDGGTAATATHIRYRRYWADRVQTLAVSLEPSDERPDVDVLVTALSFPARPLFLGRKPCLPSRPILLGRGQYASLRDALASVPRAPRADEGPLPGWWPPEPGDSADTRLIDVSDARDWANQIHQGQGALRHGRVDPPGSVP